jgi:exoribonuclease R
MMEATVDRIEDGVVVLLVQPEEKHQILVPRELVPDLKEGDIILVEFLRQERETEEAKTRVSSMIDRLKSKS